MTATAALEGIGRHARPILLSGLVAVPFLPSTGGALAPLLPWMVAGLIGIAVARLQPGEMLRQLTDPRSLLPVAAALVLFQPVLTMALYHAGLQLGLAAPVAVLLAVFASAPPLSSAPNLAILMGYDGPLALRFMLLGTMLSPLLIPVSFAVAQAGEIQPEWILQRVALILVGGLAVAIAIWAIMGPARIAAQPRVFDGVGTLIMLVFLFPLLDGVGAQVREQPGLALGLLILAVMLNLGMNLMLRSGLRHWMSRRSANAVGLVFGNRNIAILVAVLPPDPLIGLFVGVAQVPIYASPLVLSLLDRDRHSCPPLSES